MVPDDGKGIVHLRVMEQLIADSAVIGGGSCRNPVNRKADVIVVSHIGVQPSVVLFEIAARRVTRAVEGNVRDVGEPVSQPG